MRIAVLSSPTAWHYRDLQRAAASKHDIFNVEFENVCAGIETESREQFNIEADCVIVRTMPPGSLQQVVFRLDLLARLEHQGVLIVNPPKAIEAAVDKYLSLSLLHAAKIPVPKTRVAQTVELANQHFEELDEDVVVKPLFGSMGNGIKRLQNKAEAVLHFDQIVQAGNVIYQQEFVDHGGFDIRLLVIGDEVFAMKRVNKDHWITNISQGGVGETHLATDHEKRLAKSAAQAVGAWIAGVDVMYDSDSNPYVIEVNAVPGWRATSKVLNVDIAEKVLHYCEAKATS